MTNVDWYSVQAAISWAATHWANKDLKGVYGVPRGGLCPAVMLSHHMKLPLLNEAEDGCLIVDDCYETGKTLDPLRSKFPKSEFFVIVAKKPIYYGEAYRLITNDCWLVFPWEDKLQSKEDMEAYYASRQ